jgi:hypothetical protein
MRYTTSIEIALPREKVLQMLSLETVEYAIKPLGVPAFEAGVHLVGCGKRGVHMV